MKKIAFTSILILFTYLVIELFSYAAYRIKFGTYQVHDLQQSKIEAANSRDKSTVFVPANAPQNGIVRKPILHPYFGFSLDAKREIPNCEQEDKTLCFERIKVDTDYPLAKRSDKKAVIGILGGSFADGTARGGGRGYFKQVMERLPMFEGKEVVIYNMARGAYKQPQQLMQLSYFLSMGAEFDVVINLDGFNEMTATYYGWRDADLHPAFPKSWNHRVNSTLSREHLEAYSKKFTLLESRSSLAEFASGFPTRWSPMVNFAWRILDPGYVRRVANVDEQINKLSSIDKNNRDFAYEELGPDHNLDDWQQVADLSADIWMNSSLAMRDLAEGHGARYFHFLQPNQYIDGAKLLNDEERKVAILEKGGYGNVYRQGFPTLLPRVKKLQDAGVHFHDMTFLFKDTPDTLYVDNCCHLNPKGYDMVVRALAKTITDDFYDL